MRVAALYDVHGNLPALEAVLAEADGLRVDAIVAGGDVVWGPLPGECLRLLRSRGARFLRGNADRGVLAEQTEADAWCAGQLTEEERTFVAAWPETVSLAVAGLGDVLFCHGSPRSDEEIITAITPDDAVREAVAGVREPVVVCGHTHVQFDRVVDGTRVVNSGSVGLPYEGRPGAYWALLGPAVELRRTVLDTELALARMRGSGFPDVEELLKHSLVEPLSRDEATTYFEGRRGA